MSDNTVQVLAPIVLKVPSVPNFITQAGGGNLLPVDVADLTIEQLEQVGRAWTDSLIAQAAKRRAFAVAERGKR